MYWMHLKILINRISHPELLYKKGVLKNFAKFTLVTLVTQSFFERSCRILPEILLKETLWYRCFPVNFEKFKNTFFIEHNVTKMSQRGKVIISILKIYLSLQNWLKTDSKIMKNITRNTTRFLLILLKNFPENLTKLCYSMARRFWNYMGNSKN